MKCSALIIILILAPPLSAAEILVPDHYATVTAALQAASPGDIVTVGAGVYYETGLPLVDGLTLRGATGDPADVIIDGSDTAVLIEDLDGVDDITIEALTLRHGHGENGGAIHLRITSNVLISNCIFSENYARQNGGAISINYEFYWDMQSYRIEDCVFIGNTTLGKGGAVIATDRLTVRRTLFQGNTCGSTGGALDHQGGDLLVADCSFHANASRLSGGGLRADGGIVRLQRTVFTDNMVNTGSGGGASITNGIVGACRFEGNSVGYHGGGLEASPLLNLDYSDFIGNQANSVGGGAIVTGGEVTNCLFQDNGAGANGGGIQMSGPTGSFHSSTWINNHALIRGGSFSSIISGSAYTFVECSFSSSAAPNGPEGWFASTAAVTLKCCTSTPSDWAEGTLTVDDVGCGVISETASFGDLKSQYR